jgi:hypothetical protein
MVVLLFTAGCADEASVPTSSRAVEGWAPVTEPPLSPRYDAHAFWLDGRVVVMGGTDARPCPPTASCVPPDESPFRDGAALDPGTGRWRPIAEAPVPLGFATSVAIGDTAYLWITGTGESRWSAAFVAYDAGDDRWRRLPFPTGDPHEWPAARGRRRPHRGVPGNPRGRGPPRSRVRPVDRDMGRTPPRPTHPFVRPRDGVDGCRSGAARAGGRATARVRGAGCLSSRGARPPDGGMEPAAGFRGHRLRPHVVLGGRARRERVPRFGGRR